MHIPVFCSSAVNSIFFLEFFIEIILKELKEKEKESFQIRHRCECCWSTSCKKNGDFQYATIDKGENIFLGNTKEILHKLFSIRNQ
jgi:hypothetical protein